MAEMQAAVPVVSRFPVRVFYCHGTKIREGSKFTMVITGDYCNQDAVVALRMEFEQEVEFICFPKPVDLRSFDHLGGLATTLRVREGDDDSFDVCLEVAYRELRVRLSKPSTWFASVAP
jgi:hypothetical protein